MSKVGLIFIVATAASTASATAWIEGSGGSGEAGGTLATAQNTVGPASLTSIKGYVVAGDGDVYKITLVTPASFTISTNTSNVAADTQLFLFNSLGNGKAFNDDISASDLRSTLNGGLLTTLPAGTYYVGVSSYDSDAVDNSNQELWLDNPQTGVRAPDGPGAGSTVATITQPNTSSGCSYTITLTGCDPSTIGATQAPPSSAGIWTETSDAGDLIGSSQLTSGAGPLNQIRGVCTTAGDVDMYAIKITDPATFTATTVGTGTSMNDSQLWLFKPDGKGVAFNEDDPGGFNLQAALTTGVGALVPAAGTYYLAISTWDCPAMSSTNMIWQQSPFNTVRAPDGPGAAGSLTGWTYSTASIAGDYVISFTSTQFAQSSETTIVPTLLTPGPGSILAGGITEISSSNDLYMNMRPGAVLVATADPIVLLAKASAPASTATSLSVVIETKSTTSGIRQIVEARNYTTASWTVLETFTGLPTASDRSVTLVVPSPSQCIDAAHGNEIQIRVRLKNTGAVLVYPWQVRFDELTWRFAP